MSRFILLVSAFAALAAAQSPAPPPPAGDSIVVLPVHLVGLANGAVPVDATSELLTSFSSELSAFLADELVGTAQSLVPAGANLHVNITSRFDPQWTTVVSLIPVLQSPALASVLAQSLFAISNSPILAEAMPNTLALASKIAGADVKLSAAPPAVRPASNPDPASTQLPPPPSQPPICTIITTLQLSDVAVADLTSSLFFGVVESALRGFVAATLAASSGVAAPLRSMYVTAAEGPASVLGTPSTLLTVTAGVPQPVPGVYGLLADAERAPLVSPLTSAFAFGGLNTAIRVVPGVPLTAAWSLVSVTAAPGAPSPRPPQPWLPSLPPNPFSTIVAAAQATIELTGLSAANVTADDAAALADALLSEATAWAARAIPSSTFVLLAQPLVSIPALPTAQSDLQLSVSFGVYGFPALANVLARSMGAVLGTPFLAERAVPGTIALANQLAGAGGASVSVTLISATASAADAGGDPLSTPLPSPAPPSTKAALTFIIRLAGITAEQLQAGGAAAWSKVQGAVADAVAAAVAASGAGISLNPSSVAVAIDSSSSSAAASADALQLRGGRSLGFFFDAPVAAGSSVSISAAAPVTEPAPGTAGLVASAANAAFASSPALLTPVTSAASAAAGGAAVTAEVSSATAGPSQPLNGGGSGGNGGAIAGGVIGALAALGVAAAGVVYVRRRRNGGSFGSVGRWMRLPAASASSSSAATALLPAASAPPADADPTPTYGST